MLEFDPLNLRNQQVQRLIDLGVHKLRGLKEMDYKSFLPQIEVDKQAQERGYSPLIVETIPISDLTRLIDIEVLNFSLPSIKNLYSADGEYPYVTWAKVPFWKYGGWELQRREEEGWQESDSRAASLREGINYMLHYELGYDVGGLTILGTQVEDGRYLYINKYKQPKRSVYTGLFYRSLRYGADTLFCFAPGERIGPAVAHGRISLMDPETLPLDLKRLKG